MRPKRRRRSEIWAENAGVATSTKRAYLPYRPVGRRRHGPGATLIREVARDRRQAAVFSLLLLKGYKLGYNHENAWMRGLPPERGQVVKGGQAV